MFLKCFSNIFIIHVCGNIEKNVYKYLRCKHLWLLYTKVQNYWNCYSQTSQCHELLIHSFRNLRVVQKLRMGGISVFTTQTLNKGYSIPFKITNMPQYPIIRINWWFKWFKKKKMAAGIKNGHRWIKIVNLVMFWASKLVYVRHIWPKHPTNTPHYMMTKIYWRLEWWLPESKMATNGPKWSFWWCFRTIWPLVWPIWPWIQGQGQNCMFLLIGLDYIMGGWST